MDVKWTEIAFKQSWPVYIDNEGIQIALILEWYYREASRYVAKYMRCSLRYVLAPLSFKTSLSLDNTIRECLCTLHPM